MTYSISFFKHYPCQNRCRYAVLLVLVLLLHFSLDLSSSCTSRSIVLGGASSFSSPAFRCQKPLSKFGGRGSLSLQSPDGKKKTSPCDFTYFEVVDAKVDVKCTSVGTPGEGVPLEEASPVALPSTTTTTTTGGEGTCYAHVSVALELSPSLPLLLRYQLAEGVRTTPLPAEVGTNAGRQSLPTAEGKKKYRRRPRWWSDDDDTEKRDKGESLDEEWDYWRYSIALLAPTSAGGGEIHYKGFDENGYSMCCDFLQPPFSSPYSGVQGGEEESRPASPTPSSSYCHWIQTNPPSDDEPQEEGAGNRTTSRRVLLPTCPLPQTATATTAWRRNSRVIRGKIVKPLPSLAEGEWRAKVRMWRVRRGAWSDQKAKQRRTLEGLTDPETDAGEEEQQQQHTAAPPLVFMEDEERVEVLGRIVVPFSVHPDSISRTEEEERDEDSTL